MLLRTSLWVMILGSVVRGAPARLGGQAHLELLALDAAGAESLDRTSGAALGDRHVREAIVNLDLADLAARESARLAGQRAQDVAGTHLVLAAAREVQRRHCRI